MSIETHITPVTETQRNEEAPRAADTVDDGGAATRVEQSFAPLLDNSLIPSDVGKTATMAATADIRGQLPTADAHRDAFWHGMQIAHLATSANAVSGNNPRATRGS